MKKTFKTFLAAMLAAIMLIGSLPAFAAEASETLEWNYYGDTYYYDYAGEIKEGVNTVGEISDDSAFIYFDFNAEKTGFYTLSFNYEEIEGWTGIPEKIENGVAYDDIELTYHGDEDNSKILFYLEAGETVFAIDLDFTPSENAEIVVEYCGEEIASVIPGDAVIACDFYYYDCEDGTFTFDLLSDSTIIFDSGKSLKTDSLYGTTDKEPAKGINTLNIELFGKTHTAAVTLYNIDDFISKIEISNAEKYLNPVIYYDTYDSLYPYDETFTVTFTDGTTESIVYNDYESFVILPNGSKAYIWVDFDFYRDKLTMIIHVSGEIVETLECTAQYATLAENFTHLIQNNKNSLDDSIMYLKESMITLLECDTFEELADHGAANAGFYLGRSVRNFLEIFAEIFYLASFYIG